MCNSLHSSSKKIEKEGYGYKVLQIYPTTLRSPFARSIYRKNKLIKWNRSKTQGDGFCFLKKIKK